MCRLLISRIASVEQDITESATKNAPVSPNAAREPKDTRFAFYVLRRASCFVHKWENIWQQAGKNTMPGRIRSVGLKQLICQIQQRQRPRRGTMRLIDFDLNAGLPKVRNKGGMVAIQRSVCGCRLDCILTSIFGRFYPLLADRRRKRHLSLLR